MAISANGFIATEDHNTPWSNEEWEAFQSMVKKTGNMIIGRKTYELMKEDGFEMFNNPKIVVISHQTIDDQGVVSAGSTQEALTALEEAGFSEALVAGGGQINSLFMEEGLIDEVYLDVEPMLFGKGVPLFNGGAEFESRLEFLDQRMLNAHTIQLHYRVKN